MNAREMARIDTDERFYCLLGNIIEVSTGNCFSPSFLRSWETKEQVVKLFDSLKDCFNCTDCFNCELCGNCRECTACSACDYCVKCHACEGCAVCEAMSRCEQLAMCEDCFMCQWCSECKHCEKCNDCFDCVGREDCNKCEHIRGDYVEVKYERRAKANEQVA